MSYAVSCVANGWCDLCGAAGDRLALVSADSCAVSAWTYVVYCVAVSAASSGYYAEVEMAA